MSDHTEGDRELSLEWLIEEAVSLAKAAGLSCEELIARIKGVKAAGLTREELIARIEAEWRRQRRREE